MKEIKRVVLKEATQLSPEEMKHVFGGSSTSSGVEVCQSPGKACNLMVADSSGKYLPYQGKCSTLGSGGWYRCACVAGDYASSPDKTHTCVTGSGAS